MDLDLLGPWLAFGLPALGAAAAAGWAVFRVRETGIGFRVERPPRDESDALERMISEVRTAAETAAREAAGEFSAAIIRICEEAAREVLGRTEKSSAQLKGAIERRPADAAEILRALDAERDSLATALRRLGLRHARELRKADPAGSCRSALESKIKAAVGRSQDHYEAHFGAAATAPDPFDGFLVRAVKALASLHLGLLRADASFWNLFRSKKLPLSEVILGVRRVPLRAIGRRRLEGQLAGALAASLAGSVELPARLEAAASEVRRKARFNLDSAAAELEEGVDEERLKLAEEAVTGGLGRAAAAMDEFLEKVRAECDGFRNAAGREAAKAVARFARDADVSGTPGERVSAWFEGGAGRLAQVRDRAFDGLREAWESGRRAFGQVESIVGTARAQWGLASLDPAGGLDLLEGLRPEAAADRATSLYRRLFSLKPLADPEFLSGRQEDWKALETNYARLAKRRACSTALHGPAGIGKRSLVACALPEELAESGGEVLEWDRPLTEREAAASLAAALKLPVAGEGPGSFGELFPALKEAEGRTLVVHGAEALLRREVGGFDALRRFLELIRATDGAIFWVVTWEGAAWALIDRALDAGRSFVSVRRLTPWTRDETETALLARHRLSGYELVYRAPSNPGPDLAWALRRAAGPEARERLLRREAFDSVFELSGGNPFAAMHHWLRSVAKVDAKRIEIVPPPPLPRALFAHLGPEEGFVLHALHQHGAGTAELLGRAVRMESREAARTLGRLEDAGLALVKGDGSYRPNPAAAGPALRFLSDGNLSA